MRQPKRHFVTTLPNRKDDSNPPSEHYTFETVKRLTENPDPKRILVDVREPHELQSTGKIPGSHNLPISSAADGFFLTPDEFEERFGWEKPTDDHEVIFYCKAGVRSRAASALAKQANFGGKVGEYPGSWLDWHGKGGRVEREK
jgi:rhodanese-related sulfurtransferase